MESSRRGFVNFRMLGRCRLAAIRVGIGDVGSSILRMFGRCRLAGIRFGIDVVGWPVTHAKRRGGGRCGR